MDTTKSPSSPKNPPTQDLHSLEPPLSSPSTRKSFTSPTTTAKPSVQVRAQSFAHRGRRMFDVDGDRLPYWDKSNFEPERDETARVVYKPREGAEFFHKNLDKEDFKVMRNVTIEQPFFSKYNRFFPKKGHFCCKACGNPLYGHKAKLDKFDGWPAFGCCVEGAVQMISQAEKKSKDEERREAAIRIQSFVRGCMTRADVAKKLELLIDKVLVPVIEMVDENETTENTADLDVAVDVPKKPDEATSTQPEKTKHKLPARPEAILNTLSLHSLHHFSLDDSSDSEDSFGEDDSFSGDVYSAKSQKGPSSAVLLEDFVEIHCHRCKSHLGNIMKETNRGRDGVTKYKERHRVNGRALKYVEDNLPKRIRTDASLLFPNHTQRRLMGLDASTHDEDQKPAFAKERTAPFVSPRSKRRTVQQNMKSPVPSSRAGVGIRTVTFQSPQKSPDSEARFKSKKKSLEDFFLSRSVH